MNPIIDIETLLEEISPDSPCGDDLEYDSDYVAMDQASQGKEARQSGDAILAAEDPDWKAVKSRAVDLLKRSKDIRVGVYLTRALLATDGLLGLSDGLDLVLGLIERHWEGLHPRLDPDDANDPTSRVNALLNLCGQDTMLRPLRDVELVSAKGLGRYSFRDYLVAAGKLPAPSLEGSLPPGMAEIDAAFMGCDLIELQERAKALNHSVERIESIESTLMDKVGSSRAVSFSAAVELLKELGGVLTVQLSKRGVETPEGAAPAGAAKAVAGEVNTREDVIRVLDKACEYFRRNEPSSPVPLLLERAKKLVSKDFLEIVRDLAPAGLNEVENIRGRSPD